MTIKQHFETIAAPVIRDRALRNAEKDGELDTVVPSLYAALAGGFTWKYTPEGYDYWRNICTLAERGELGIVK